MKKLFLLTVFCVYAATVQARVYADDFVFQKQMLINGQNTCQAFRIHPRWFATAAHCVETCLSGGCRIKLLLAQGEVNAIAELTARDVFIPPEYRQVDKEQRVRTYKVWDIALLHYHPEDFIYEFAEGGYAHRADFEQALQKDRSLRLQWHGAVKPKIPVIYTYNGPDLMTLQNNLIVPRWNWGELEIFSDPKTVLYFGERKALWGADGFGVDHGNSGGAVVLDDGGIIGVAAAKADNQLPAFVKQAFPTFGRADEFFLFVGFGPKTTLKFIKNTLLKFGDRIQTKKLKRVVPTVQVQP